MAVGITCGHSSSMAIFDNGEVTIVTWDPKKKKKNNATALNVADL